MTASENRKRVVIKKIVFCSSRHGSVKTNLTVSMRTQVRSLVLLEGLRIQHCYDLWCRSQTGLIPLPKKPIKRQKNIPFFLFRATPMADGGYQTRGLIGAAAVGLCHSHSNTGSKPHFRTTPKLVAILAPYPTERDQGSNLHPYGY